MCLLEAMRSKDQFRAARGASKVLPESWATDGWKFQFRRPGRTESFL